MKTALHMPPWGAPTPTPELMEAIELLGNNVSSTARAAYNRDCRQKQAQGKQGHKGMQAAINAVIKERFLEAGWVGKDGRFMKNGTMIRVSFRHYSTIGSDILDAMRACAKENIQLVALFACESDALKVIAPSQAASMVSFSKYGAELKSLDGVIDIPLIYGELIPKSF